MLTQSLPDTPSTRERLQLTAFTLFCFLAFTYNLSEVPPYHTDENFYVTSTRTMIDSKDYITPTYQGKKRFAKPILFYWLVAASYKMFGISLPLREKCVIAKGVPSLLFVAPARGRDVGGDLRTLRSEQLCSNP